MGTRGAELKLPGATGTVLFNPTSGGQLPPAEREALRSACLERGWEVIEVGREVDVTEIVRERLAGRCRLFIAAGGDGTIHHTLQGIVNSEAVLAVLPIGTYNHFARDLGIPVGWRQAIEIAERGATRQIDCARVNDRFFVNNVSLGLYPEMVAKREERGRDYPRWKARLLSFAWTLRRYPHVNLTVETEHHHDVIRTHVFMVSNNSYDLSRIGVEAPRNTMTAGQLSIYWLPHVPRVALMRFVAHYLAGRVTQMPGFRSRRSMRLKVHSSHGHLDLGIDGELFRLATPLTMTTVPQSLLVRVPR